MAIAVIAVRCRVDTTSNFTQNEFELSKSVSSAHWALLCEDCLSGRTLANLSSCKKGKRKKETFPHFLYFSILVSFRLLPQLPTVVPILIRAIINWTLWCHLNLLADCVNSEPTGVDHIKLISQFCYSQPVERFLMPPSRGDSLPLGEYYHI